MSGLLGSLGLNEVSADPNDVPVGTYDAVIHSSELVLAKNKDTVAHVITFRVKDGEFKGAKPAQWNQLGKEPRDANDQFPATPEAITKYNPTMSDQQKSYYKKTWMDCGVPEDQIGNLPPEALNGKEVEIRVYTNNGYKNVAVNGPSKSAPATDGSVTFEGGAVNPF